MMLSELCKELNNWDFDRRADRYRGTFTISDGLLHGADSILKEGQYYRIVGSIFNDGVHRYGDFADVLEDETFDGSVWAMAVPPAVVALADEIEAWVADNAAAINSPYVSESFGGYSYSKGYSGQGSQSGSVTWQSHFADKLNRWRKIQGLR